MADRWRARSGRKRQGLVKVGRIARRSIDATGGADPGDWPFCVLGQAERGSKQHESQPVLILAWGSEECLTDGTW